MQTMYVRLDYAGTGVMGHYRVLTCPADGKFNWQQNYSGPFYRALAVFNTYVEDGYEIC